VLATALAAASHALAGGGTPSPLALGIGVVFGGMLSTFALTRRPSLPRLAISVGATQLAFHVVFSVLGTANTATGGHHHAPVVTAQPHAHTDSPAMWFAHAVAGVLTLALLQGAERAAWRLLTELVRLVALPFRLAAVAHRPTAATATPNTVSPAPLRGRLLVSAASRRGPPVPVAF
jgi:hypothetical protein